MKNVQLTESTRVRVDTAGRVVIPAELRQRLGIKPGQELILSETPGGIQVQTFRQVLTDAQDFFAHYAIPGKSVVDELIRERCDEARRESGE
jgi:AbrB family looped-hinge helix DNA binding protein